MNHGRLLVPAAVSAAVVLLAACSSAPSVPRGTVPPIVLQAQEPASGWQPAAPSSAGVEMPDDTALPVRKKVGNLPGAGTGTDRAVPPSEGTGEETRHVKLATPSAPVDDVEIALPVRKKVQ